VELTEVSIDAIVALVKQKANKMVFSTEDLFKLKFFVKKKVTTIDE